MNEDFNYRCNQLKKNLETLINESNMPIAVVYFILKDLYNEIEKMNIAYLNSIAVPKTETLYDADADQDDDQDDDQNNN